MEEDGGEECEVEEENDRCGHEKGSREVWFFFFGEREMVSLVYNIREERMEGECDDIVLCEFSLFPQERKMFSYLCRQWIIMSKGIISYMHRVFLVDVLHVLV